MIITVGKISENLILEDIEHALLTEEWISVTLQVASLFVSLLIILLNGTIVKMILKQEKKTFLDWMVVIDSHLCISIIIPLAMFVLNFPHSEFDCMIKIGLMFFVSITNRIVSVIIVIYRAFYALMPHLVETQTKRRILNVTLIGFLCFLSVGSTLGMAEYREDYKSFKGLF